MTTDEEKVQIGVQSLEIGLTVLDALIAHNAPTMLKDLATTLSMHPAKVHRYVVSLIRKGYAKQLHDGRYSLGERAYSLGISAVKRNDLLQLIQNFIIEIQQYLNCSVHVSKWLSEGPIVVQSLESNHPINIITRVGSRMPLLNSATGRLHACYQSETRVDQLLQKEWSEVKNKNKFPENMQQFLKLKAQILQQGYSLVKGEMLLGMNAISIPIFNYHQDVEYVITCIGTDEHLPEVEMTQIIEYLLSMKNKIQAYINN